MPVSSEKNQHKSSLLGNSPRLLAIDHKQPSFVKLAVKMNENGIHSPQFRWASKVEAALSLLRTEHIDCILYVEFCQFLIDSENRKQFLRNLQAIRTSNPITPVIVIVDQLPEELWEKCLNYSCEIFLSDQPWNSSAILGVINHATKRSFFQKEHSRLSSEKNQQLELERDEAEKLLAQQRSIVAEIERITSDVPSIKQDGLTAERFSTEKDSVSSENQKTEMEEELENLYSELLRSYVVMGSENLTNEISRMAKKFYRSKVTVRDAFKIHLNAVDQLVSNLGKRSSRQVISRSDLLVMELMIQLCDLNQA